MTRYEKLSLDINYLKNTEHLPDEQIQDDISGIKHKLEEEQKAQTLYFPELQQIFGLANLVTDKNGYEHLEKFQYPPLEWARDHGYYIKENCEE